MESLDPLVVEHALLSRLLADQELGRLQAEEDYQQLFPGHRELVARLVHDATLAARSTSVEIGDVGIFGSFEPLELLGRGGQGVVYLARDTKLPRMVALKVLAGTGSLDQARTQRFRREAEVAARLDHPGLCRVLEFGLKGGVPFLAMQYVQGTPLAKALQRHDTTSLSELATPTSSNPSAARTEQVVSFVAKVAEALHAAHEEGVVHRDVKPANIMITPAGDPVVLDFGLARDEDLDGISLTVSSDMLGTPAYMAPEQIDGKSRSDRRTDVFALGVVLYECLTGVRPFEAATRQQMFDKVLRGHFEPASRLRPRISRDLDQVLSVALDVDKNRRYETAAAFAEDLQRILQHQPVMARPAGWLVHIHRWSRRNRLLAISLAAILVVSITATVVTTSALLESDAARSESEAINEFILKDMLAAANPRGLGREVRVVDSLKRSVSRIDMRLGHEPQLAATVRFEIAKTYASLGLWDESLELARQALATRRAEFGADSAKGLEVELHIAECLATASRTDDARQALLKLEPRLAPVFGDDSSEVLTCKARLCETQTAPQRAEATRQESLRLLARCEQRFGPVAETTRLVRTIRIDLLQRANLDLEALELAKRHTTLITEEFGATSFLAIESRLAYCNGLRGVGKLRDALDLLPELVSQAETALGPHHPEYLVALQSLGACYSTLRMKDQAVATMRLVKDRATAALGSDHPWTLEFAKDLALSLRRIYNYEEALEVLDETLAIQQRVSGADSEQVAALLAVKSSIYRGMKQPSLAVATAQQALDIQQRVVGEGDPTLFQYVFQLCCAKQLAGDLADATKLKRQSIELAKTAYGTDSHWYADSLAQLGELLVLQEQFSDAEAPLREAIAFRRSEQPTNIDRLYFARALLAMARYRQGDTDGVREELEAAWEKLLSIDRLKFRARKANFFPILEDIYKQNGNEQQLQRVRKWIRGRRR